MAKKDKKKSQDNTMEESMGSKLVTALIVIVIVAIWLLIFGVLIKLDVGNFGSSVLTPVLKDVPVLNWIPARIPAATTAARAVSMTT